MINGPKWPFFTFLPLFWAAMGSNIFFLFHLFHASWSEITHRKNHRKYFFHEKQYFWHFWPKTLIQRACYRTLLSKMALADSNIGVRQKYRKPCLSEITHRKILKICFWWKLIFLAFLGQKREKWAMRESAFFTILAKIKKMAKKNIFYFEKWKFFWHTLIIWEDQHFSCNTLFDSVKKWEKAKKNGPCTKVYFFPFLPTFLTKSKMWKLKNLGLPKWLRCAKKIPLSKRKNDFWPFSCFGQNHKK